LAWGNECDPPKEATKGDRKKALAAGCDEYDTKPIKMPRLLGKIKTLMQKVQ
jgi:CheY-like chemotaxis protein